MVCEENISHQANAQLTARERVCVRLCVLAQSTGASKGFGFVDYDNPVSAQVTYVPRCVCVCVRACGLWIYENYNSAQIGRCMTARAKTDTERGRVREAV